MARKTNTEVNGNKYFRVYRKVGERINENGVTVSVKKNFYGLSKEEAEQKYREYLELVKSGINPDKKRKYFGVVFTEWLNEFFLYDESLANQTRRRYFGAWQKWAADADFTKMELNAVSPADVQRFFNRTDAPLSSQKAILKLLRNFTKYALAESLILRDFSAVVKLRREEVKEDAEENIIEVWQGDELERIFSNFDKADSRFRLRFLLHLLADTGCRIAEALGVKYDDFVSTKDGIFLSIKRQIIREQDFKDSDTKHNLKASILKTASSKRLIPVSDSLLRELEIHKAWHKRDMLENGYRTEYCFTTKTGKFLDVTNIRHQAYRYYERCNVPKRGFHCYRHTFATNLSENGVPIEVASRLLGHSDISVTAQYYTSISNKRLVEAIKALNY